MTRPLFRPGRRIPSLLALVRTIEAGRWVYAFGQHARPSSAAWLRNMSLATLRDMVSRGARYAIRRKP